RDAAGRNAAARLRDRLRSLSVEAIQLTPRRKDFNDDLIADGADMLAAQLAAQLTADNRQRFLGARGR
ncbi:MAG: DNA primase, partial [Parvularculaceae bacterium]